MNQLSGKRILITGGKANATSIGVREKAIEKLQSNQSLTLSDVARDLCVSRERIRQIADGIPRASRHRPIKYCSSCGIRIYSHRKDYLAFAKRLCPICYKNYLYEKFRVSFICELCGRKFYRMKSQVKAATKNGMHIRFCSNKCQGKWFGSLSKKGGNV